MNIAATLAVVVFTVASPAFAEDAPAAAAAKVKVSFKAKDASKKYVVNGAGTSCSMPCSLQLPAGPQFVFFQGDGEYGEMLTIPSTGGTVIADLGDKGALMTGRILLGAGTAVILIGAAFTPLLGAIPILVIVAVGLGMLIPGWIMTSNVHNELKWEPAAHSERPISVPFATRLRPLGESPPEA